MRTEQNAVLAGLRRTQQFLDAHADALTAINPSVREQLDDVVAQLTDLSVAQDTGARGSKGETSRQRALRLVLRRTYMAPIAGIAKYLLRDVPEFSALMLPPVGAGVQTTVTAAYAMANAASTHAQTLIVNGLPSTFVEDLRAAATQVSDSLTGRTKHQGTRTGATAGLGAAEKRGRAILSMLNVLVRAHAGDDAPLLAEWKAAKRLRRKSGPATGSKASEPAPPHPVAVVMPASLAMPQPAEAA